jgi:predicted RNA-binding Zn ribbon-like protein
MTKAAKRAAAPGIPASGDKTESSLSLPVWGGLTLDLINTEMLSRGKKHDALSTPAALALWWGGACKQYPDECVIGGAREPTAWTREMLDAVKALRRALRALLARVVERHAVEEEDLKPVNDILAEGYSALARTTQGGVRAVMHQRDPEKSGLLFPIALSALHLFTECDWQRLHQCKSDRCILYFYDTTKSGTRRWCSPGCMNRARSIHQYHLSKKGRSLRQP